MLRIDEVVKRFGGVIAVDGVSLDIARGEFFALLGPSGCGKTTLLRMLAGFEQPDGGRLLLGGADIASTPPHRRPVNMMFQSYALFPHLSVEGNIAFGLRRAGMPRAEIAQRVAEMMALARLDGLGARKPDQLSGGQQQRVALARALARRPQLLLLDEPLAALDRKLREETQRELKDVQRRLGMTFIIVTHDQDEAMTMADRIGVMNRGRLAQVGTARELYDAPASRWIASFIGDANLLDGDLTAQHGATVTIEVAGVGVIAAGAPAQPVSGRAVCAAIRPERVSLRSASSATPNRFEGVLTAATFLGDSTVCEVRLDAGATLRASVPSALRPDTPLDVGGRVAMAIDPRDVVVLPR